MLHESLFSSRINFSRLDLVALTNDVEGSDNEEQDASSGVAVDVRNGGENDALMDARNSRKCGKFLR